MFVIWLSVIHQFGYGVLWCYLWLSTQKKTKASKDGVLVYDFLDSKWRSPETTGTGGGTGAGPGRRQGHSATALQRQLCVGIDLAAIGTRALEWLTGEFGEEFRTMLIVLLDIPG